MKEKKLNIIIDTKIVEASNLTKERFEEILNCLQSIFKNKFLKIIHRSKNEKNIIEINDTLTVNYLASLYENLNKLKNCKNFDKFIDRFDDGGQFWHNYFVASLAGFLFSRVDTIIFEPFASESKDVENTKEVLSNDFCIKIGDIDIHIECKTIKIDNNEFKKISQEIYNEHLESAKLVREKLPNSILGKYKMIITLKKKDSFLAENIIKLCDTVKDKIPYIKNPGTIIENDNYKAIASFIESDEGDYNKIYMKIKEMKLPLTIGEEESLILIGNINEDQILYIETLIYDQYGNWHIGYTFATEKLTVLTMGPIGDFEKLLRRAITKGRAQSPIDKPYILAIDMEGEFGNIEKNRKILYNIFQPKSNTRYNGILLVNKKDSREMNIEYINNPYPKNPISIDLHNLLRQN